MPGIPGHARDPQQLLRRYRLRKRGGENKAADIPQKAGVPESQAPVNLCLPYRSLPCLRHLPGYPRVSGANCFYFPARLRFVPQAFFRLSGPSVAPERSSTGYRVLDLPGPSEYFLFPRGLAGVGAGGGGGVPRCSAGRGQDSGGQAFFIRGLSFVSPRGGGLYCHGGWRAETSCSFSPVFLTSLFRPRRGWTWRPVWGLRTHTH